MQNKNLALIQNFILLSCNCMFILKKGKSKQLVLCMDEEFQKYLGTQSFTFSRCFKLQFSL